jgi:hypothetical protein
MPAFELHALLVSPVSTTAIRPRIRAGARVRFGSEEARRVKRCRPLRRTKLNVDILTMSGTHRAELASITLYGASLDGGRRLRRREMLALRLPSGGRVQARVRWRLGRRCGVQFLSPVADFARLLRENRLAQGPRAPFRPPSAPPLRSNDQGSRMRQLRCALSRAQRLGRQILRWCRSL